MSMAMSSVISWSEQRRWLWNHGPLVNIGTLVNIALPPNAKLPITLCPLESHFGCHFVSWQMNIRHILSSISRIVYWIDRYDNSYGITWKGPTSIKQKNEMTICPLEEQVLRIFFLTLLYIPGTNGDAAGSLQNCELRGFPGGAVGGNLPANAGDTGSIPGPGRFPHAAEQLSPCATTTAPAL